MLKASKKILSAMQKYVKITGTTKQKMPANDASSLR
jgi:hypothetical protein